MSIEEITALVHGTGKWPESKDDAQARLLDSLFGGKGRYHSDLKKRFALRSNLQRSETNVPYIGWIHPSNPDSGAYGGMSIAIFPSAAGRCLLTFVVGTGGVAPDEDILARPGHARKLQAVCRWLNAKHGNGKMIAWAKHDPIRTDIPLPAIATQEPFGSYGSALDTYGHVLYAIVAPTGDEAATSDAVRAFFDLMVEARGGAVLAAFDAEAKALRSEWFAYLFPDVTEDNLAELLRHRRFVVVEGPPGTGKTRLALRLLENQYGNNGRAIQFHPNTTYETFVGGLAPVQSKDALGLQFAPTAGDLMRAISEANANPKRDYLLVIDEINRADLAKVLGEAIFLFEPSEERSIDLPYEFGDAGRTLRIPPNLHVLGTMNTADRSLAVVDVAIRRRFAFVKLWPQMGVVQKQEIKPLSDAADELTNIFVEYATGDAFDLVPGHSYFLRIDGVSPSDQLRSTISPLLEEYLAQGYVSGFGEHIRAYLQWLESVGSED